ncbi:hypothetical protein DZ08F97_42580 [Escherichia coli]
MRVLKWMGYIFNGMDIDNNASDQSDKAGEKEENKKVFIKYKN